VCDHNYVSVRPGRRAASLGGAAPDRLGFAQSTPRKAVWCAQFPSSRTATDCASCRIGMSAAIVSRHSSPALPHSGGGRRRCRTILP